MFKTRLISGILLVIAALLTIISGGYVLFYWKSSDIWVLFFIISACSLALKAMD